MSKIQPKPLDADQRPCIEVFDNNGILIERSYGNTQEELQKLHDDHKCGAFCGICYEEAMKVLEERNE